MIPPNLLHIEAADSDAELFEDLLRRPGLRVERIVSRGHTTPPDQPYVQGWDEWVLVLRGSARLLVEDQGEMLLEPGAHRLIPAGTPHWVTHTADPTIWLAIHLDEP
jgi:cupin 2 domain-containing protein